MSFKASTDYENKELSNNFIKLKDYEEVETKAGWKFVDDLSIGDKVLSDNNYLTVSTISHNENVYTIWFNCLNSEGVDK